MNKINQFRKSINHLSEKVNTNSIKIQRDFSTSLDGQHNDFQSIKYLISKKRLNVIIPIKIFNPINNENEIKIIHMGCGFINHNTVQNSVRSMLNKNTSFLGEAFYNYGEKRNLNNKSMMWANDILISLKVMNIAHNINLIDDVQLNESLYTIPELIDKLDMEYKETLTQNIDLFKCERKDVIMLNDPIDMVDETHNILSDTIYKVNNLDRQEDIIRERLYMHYTNLLQSYILMGDITERLINTTNNLPVLPMDRLSISSIHLKISKEKIMNRSLLFNLFDLHYIIKI